MPETLRKICDRIGVPWTMAYAHAGYYGEILESSRSLSLLADKWLKEDDAHPDRARSSAAYYRSPASPSGRLSSSPDLPRATRSAVGLNSHHSTAERRTLNNSTPEHREAFKRFYEEESKEPRTVCVYRAKAARFGDPNRRRRISRGAAISIRVAPIGTQLTYLPRQRKVDRTR